MVKRNSDELEPQESASDAEPNVVRFEDLKLRKVELQDYPNTLPHGFFVDGQRLQTLELASYNPNQDLQLGKLYSSPNAKIKAILGEFLPKIIKSIGGVELTELARSLSVPPKTLIEQMPLIDAMTVVLNARVNNVGMDIKMDAQCPNCKTQNVDDPEECRPYHELSEVEIGVFNNPITSKLIVEVTLEHGFYVGEDLCKTLRLRPIRLYELEKISKAPRGYLDVALLYQQVCEIPEASILQGVKGQLFNDELYATMKSLDDRNLLLKASRKLQELGPGMSVNMTCHNCGNNWDESLSWGDLRTFLFQSANA